MNNLNFLLFFLSIIVVVFSYKIHNNHNFNNLCIMKNRNNLKMSLSEDFNKLKTISKSKYEKIDEKSRNVGTGVIAGSIILGPLGAVIGGGLGAFLSDNNSGSNGNNSNNKLKPEMISKIKIMIEQLQEAEESLDINEAQLLQVRRLNNKISNLIDQQHNKASECLSHGDEQGARDWLKKWSDSKELQVKSTDDVILAEKRVTQMQEYIIQLTNQLKDFEELVVRSNIASNSINFNDIDYIDE